MSGPLTGIRVLDLSRVLSGPWCTMTLADLGAEVIKVERPGTGDETRGWGPPFAGGESAYFLSTNRNKRSVALDLSREDHLEAARRLVARCDVVVENFRPGTIDRLGLGEAACRAINPAIIYASITGFGRSGTAAERPGYDVIIQGQGGLMSITGEADAEPVKVGVAISDITAGLYATIGILAALVERARGGPGRRVHVSLLGTQVSWLANQAANHLVGGVEPGRMGNAHPNLVPYQVFDAADRPFVLAVANEPIWGRFCAAIGRADLRDDARFSTNARRVENRDTLIEILAELFIARPRDAWLEDLQGAEVPCGPLNTIAQVFADEAVKALSMVAEVEHPTAGRISMVRSPIDIDDQPLPVTIPPPTLGQHTDEVLRDLGFSAHEIAAMIEGSA